MRSRVVPHDILLSRRSRKRSVFADFSELNCIKLRLSLRLNGNAETKARNAVDLVPHSVCFFVNHHRLSSLVVTVLNEKLSLRESRTAIVYRQKLSKASMLWQISVQPKK